MTSSSNSNVSRPGLCTLSNSIAVCVVSFLDSATLYRLYSVLLRGKYLEPTIEQRPYVPDIIVCVEEAAQKRFTSQIRSPEEPLPEDSVDRKVSNLPLKRGGVTSWPEALHEIGTWSQIRLAAGGSLCFPSDASLMHNMAHLRRLEGIASRTFPVMSL
jgi:hypothetical protein